jgi:hypothetical protein
MVEPINLNKARKARAHVQATAKASENRARFGRTKAERELAAAQLEKDLRAFEARKREDP